VRSSTTPGFAYHNERATCNLPVDRRVVMLKASVRGKWSAGSGSG
jgi:hypothetical protein